MIDSRPDSVLIQKNGGARKVPVTEYLRLPVEEQVELLLRGKVSFYCGEQSMQTKQALKELRKMKVTQ